MKRFFLIVLAVALTVICVLLSVAISSLPAYPEWSYEAADGANLPAQVFGGLALIMYFMAFQTWNWLFHDRPWRFIKGLFTNYFSSTSPTR